MEPIQQPIFPAWRAEGPGAAKLGLVSSLPGVQKALERQNLVLGEGRALRLHGQYVAHVVVCLICNFARACRSCTGTATKAQPGQIAPLGLWRTVTYVTVLLVVTGFRPTARWTDVHSVETDALANAINLVSTRADCSMETVVLANATDFVFDPCGLQFTLLTFLQSATASTRNGGPFFDIRSPTEPCRSASLSIARSVFGLQDQDNLQHSNGDRPSHIFSAGAETGAQESRLYLSNVPRADVLKTYLQHISTCPPFEDILKLCIWNFGTVDIFFFPSCNSRFSASIVGKLISGKHSFLSRRIGDSSIRRRIPVFRLQLK